MNDGYTDVPPASGSLDYTQQLTDVIMYLEIIAGGMIEVIWIAKIFLVFYIILGAWRVVRK